MGLALASFAAAKVIELGDQTATPLVAPSCPPGVKPAQCTIVLTRVTALATIRDGVSYPTRVNRGGRIVAFSVGLSALSSNTSTRKKDINFLNQTYGGDAQVEITILRRIGHKGQRWQVVKQGPIFHVVQFLGSVVQLPLLNSIQVRPGEAIALTTPTWAPVLSIDLSRRNFAYRQARGTHPNCRQPPSSEQAQRVGEISQYPCKYAGTRAEYAATEITYPRTSNPVH
ncbi:MAG: hypothetical protein ACJ764_14485 [Solirubrobacteraceae bacterium]